MKSADNVTASAESGTPATTCNLPHVPPGAFIFYPDDPPPTPPQDLPETDGVPLESDWHRLAITLLIETVRWHWRDRKDYYVGGNMFVYFSAQQVRNQDYRGPDFFFVQGYDPIRPAKLGRFGMRAANSRISSLSFCQRQRGRKS